MPSSRKNVQTPQAQNTEKFDNLDAFEAQQALADMLDVPVDLETEAGGDTHSELHAQEISTETPAIISMTEQSNQFGLDERRDQDGSSLHPIEGLEEKHSPEDQPCENAPPLNPFEAATEAAHHTRMVEALLFAATEPLELSSMKARLPDGIDLPAVLDTLRGHYQNRGINLMQTGQKYLFVTAPDMAPLLQDHRIQPKKLSRAAMETLAIIAYHQPCSRAEIEEIRGVSVSKGSLDLLLEIGWLKLRGRRETTPGRPLLYGTSHTFLEHFGLEKISHLPGMADLKAAGLLDARLPAGFEVPRPLDEEGDAEALSLRHDGDDDPSEAGNAPNFMHDFFEESS